MPVREISDFTDLEIYSLAEKITVLIYEITAGFPVDEKYISVRHLKESSQSLGANIAEGWGRYHFRDRRLFIYNTRGSLYEIKHFLRSAEVLGFLKRCEQNRIKELDELITVLGVKLNNTVSALNKQLSRASLQKVTTSYNKLPQVTKERGFTLIELLVVISVITLLTAFSVPAFISFQKSQTLNTAAGKLKEDLRLLQSKSTSSIAVSDQSRAWGVHLTDGSSSYRFFYCTPDPKRYEEYRLGSSRCASSTLINFDTSSIVTKVAGTTEWDIVFDVLTGTVVFNGGVSATDLQIAVSYADSSDSRLIRIGPGGSIGD